MPFRRATGRCVQQNTDIQIGSWGIIRRAYRIIRRFARCGLPTRFNCRKPPDNIWIEFIIVSKKVVVGVGLILMSMTASSPSSQLGLTPVVNLLPGMLTYSSKELSRVAKLNRFSLDDDPVSNRCPISRLKSTGRRCTGWYRESDNQHFG